MDIFSIFLVLSVIAILYVLHIVLLKKRAHILIETVSLGIYLLFLILSIFPQIVIFIENYISIHNVVTLLLCIFVYFLFAISLMLYHYCESLRVDITKLTQEIAFLKFENEESKQNKQDEKEKHKSKK